MLSDDELRAVLIAEARRMAEQAGENPDSMTVDEDMLAQVMLAGRAVEREAYERAAKECDKIQEAYSRMGIASPYGDRFADAIRALGGSDGN